MVISFTSKQLRFLCKNKMLDLKNITSNNMNSPTEENYLKAIFHLLDS